MSAATVQDQSAADALEASRMRVSETLEADISAERENPNIVPGAAYAKATGSLDAHLRAAVTIIRNLAADLALQYRYIDELKERLAEYEGEDQ